MPLWTRVLNKSDYGFFSLITVTIGFMIAFSKFGLQHAALRFYSDFREGKRDMDLNYYYSTMLIGAILISVPVTIILFSAIWYTFPRNGQDAFISLLPVIIVITVIRAVINILMVVIRAEERAGLFSLISVLQRYGQLSFSIVFGILLGMHLSGIFVGWLLSSIFILIPLLYYFLSQGRMKVRNFSFPLFKESIYYGFPLIWFELSNIFLNVGDRYVIQFIMGAEAVGVYSAGYNAVDIVQSLISLPLKMAVIPIYLNMWNRDGEEKVKEFLSNSLSYYLMFGIPIILGMIWFREEIIVLLASAKYRESADIIPYTIIPLVLYGALGVYGAGLYIMKKTNFLMYSTLLCGILNLLLNILLIPHYGIMGAAYATLVAYAMLIAIIYRTSSQYLKISVEWNHLLKYLLFSFSVMLVLSFFASYHILIKILIGLFLYSIEVLVLDNRIKWFLMQTLQKFKLMKGKVT